jgi:IS element ISTsi1 orfA, putative resolvase
MLLKMVCNNEVRNVYIIYKDRLTRFGYRYLETMFMAHNVNIVVVKDTAYKKTVSEELVEDLMSLIASFSGKLYGLRANKNKERG